MIAELRLPTVKIYQFSVNLRKLLEYLLQVL